MDRTSSNLVVKPNLTVMDLHGYPKPGDPRYSGYPEYLQYLSVEQLLEVLPKYCLHKRVIDRYLAPWQLQEYLNQLACLRCGRPCAGTCETD